MSKLEDLIAELCPDGVAFLEVGSVSKVMTPKAKIKSHDYLTEGDYPVIDQGQDFIGGYTNESGAFPKDEYIIFGDHTCVVKYVDFSFVQGADGVKVLTAKKDKILPKYLYYCMDSIRMDVSYARHWSKMKVERIPVPPLEVQREIVRVLDKFTFLSAELSAELSARRTQYEYYREKLLTFEDNIPYQTVKVGEVCKVESGGTPSKKNKEYWNNGTIKWLGSSVCQNKKSVDEITDYITDEGLKHSSAKIQHADTTLIAMVGATIGKVAYLTFDAATNQNVASLCPLDNNELYAPFLYYACTTLYGKFQELGKNGFAMASLGFIRNLDLTIPSFEEQKRIADTLDRFERLCGDITEGLPAEIDARQKQYEYYRDKLLALKELEV